MATLEPNHHLGRNLAKQIAAEHSGKALSYDEFADTAVNIAGGVNYTAVTALSYAWALREAARLSGTDVSALDQLVVGVTADALMTERER